MTGYRIEVGSCGDAAVTDERGNLVWVYRTGMGSAAPEMVCDALVEALTWTAQRHSGLLAVELGDAHVAHELLSAVPIDPGSRLASMLDEARMLLTWFERTDVVLRDVDALVA
jgi:hypothetical protein